MGRIWVERQADDFCRSAETRVRLMDASMKCGRKGVDEGQIQVNPARQTSTSDLLGSRFGHSASDTSGLKPGVRVGGPGLAADWLAGRGSEPREEALRREGGLGCHLSTRILPKTNWKPLLEDYVPLQGLLSVSKPGRVD